MAAKKKKLPEPFDEIDARRLAAGQCRHCGGEVPCWSPFGDAEVGRRWRDLTAKERRKIEAAS